MAFKHHFDRVKIHLSDAETELQGDGEDYINPKKLIRARTNIVQALESFDRTCHKHQYEAKPPRADI